MAEIDCPPLLAPESKNCSGRGVCVSASWCECEEGFTGVGDFAFGSPTCNINLVAVKVLWSLLAFLHLMQFFYVFYFLSQKLEKQRKSQRLLTLAMAALMVVGNIMFFSASIIRIVYTNTRTIGASTAVTVLFSLGCASYWTMIHTFIYSFLQLVSDQALQYRKSAKHLARFRRFRRALILSAISATIFSMCPLGMLFHHSTLGFEILGRLHYLGLGVTCFVTGILILPVFLREIQIEVEEGRKAIIGHLNGAKAECFDRLSNRIAKFSGELHRQIIAQTVFAFLFGLWPFLRISGSSYFLPIAWMSGSLGGFLIMYVSAPVKIDSETSLISSSDGTKVDGTPLSHMPFWDRGRNA